MRIMIIGESSKIGFKKNEAGRKGNCLDRINGCELLLPPVIDNHCIEELYVNTAVEPPRPSSPPDPRSPLDEGKPPEDDGELALESDEDGEASAESGGNGEEKEPVSWSLNFPFVRTMDTWTSIYSSDDIARFCVGEFGAEHPSRDTPEAATLFWRRYVNDLLAGKYPKRVGVLKSYLDGNHWHGFIGDWDWLIIDCAAIVRDVSLFLHGADREELDANSIVNVIDGHGKFINRTLYQWAEKIEDRMRRGQCILLLNDRETARLSKSLVSHLYCCKDSAYERSSSLQHYLNTERYVPSADSKSGSVETGQEEEYPDPPPSLTDVNSWGSSIRCIRGVPDASPASHKSPKTVPSFDKPPFALDGFDPDTGWFDDPEVDRTLERQTPVDRFCSNSNGLSVLATDANGYPVSFMLARGQGALIVLPRSLLGDTFMKKLEDRGSLKGFRLLSGYLRLQSDADGRRKTAKNAAERSLANWRKARFVLVEPPGGKRQLFVEVGDAKWEVVDLDTVTSSDPKALNLLGNNGKPQNAWNYLRRIAESADRRTLDLSQGSRKSGAANTAVSGLRKTLVALLCNPRHCNETRRPELTWDWESGSGQALRSRVARVWGSAFEVVIHDSAPGETEATNRREDKKRSVIY